MDPAPLRSIKIDRTVQLAPSWTLPRLTSMIQTVRVLEFVENIITSKIRLIIYHLK